MWLCSAMKSESNPRSSRARPRAAGPMPWSVTKVDTPIFTATPRSATPRFGMRVGTRVLGGYPRDRSSHVADRRAADGREMRPEVDRSSSDRHIHSTEVACSACRRRPAVTGCGGCARECADFHTEAEGGAARVVTLVCRGGAGDVGTCARHVIGNLAECVVPNASRFDGGQPTWLHPSAPRRSREPGFREARERAAVGRREPNAIRQLPAVTSSFRDMYPRETQ